MRSHLESVFIRFSRYRFRPGAETEGLETLRRQAQAIKKADGCQDVWLAQGQHPSTEIVLIARFRDEASLRSYDGRLRSDPILGSAFFALLSMTTQPPEVTQYELRDAG